ncbi:DUF397 domain-containing protein [Micromonospora sp. I033]
MRDSHDPTGPVLTVDPAAWPRFVKLAERGRRRTSEDTASWHPVAAHALEHRAAPWARQPAACSPSPRAGRVGGTRERVCGRRAGAGSPVMWC